MLPFLIVLAILVVVVLIVTAPFRAKTDAGAPAAPEPDGDQAGRLDELHAAREAKYREIRDAQLDQATGKLAQEDWQAIDGRLRAEALAILDEIELLEHAPDGA